MHTTSESHELHSSSKPRAVDRGMIAPPRTKHACSASHSLPNDCDVECAPPTPTIEFSAQIDQIDDVDEDSDLWDMLPRNVDATALPTPDRESPLLWPPLPNAERERKAAGLRILQTDLWNFGRPEIWKPTGSVWSHQHTLPTQQHPALMSKEVPVASGLGFDLGCPDVSSLNEFKVALAFEQTKSS